MSDTPNRSRKIKTAREKRITAEVSVVRLLDDEAKALKSLAAKTGRTPTMMVRFALALFFRRMGMVFPGSEKWELGEK